MKNLFLLLAITFCLKNFAYAQCTTMITPDGTVNICPGSDVTLSAPNGNVWTSKAQVGGGDRIYAAGFSIGAKGYIGTGTGDISGFPKYRDFWEYDPVTNTWTQKADFGGTARQNAVGFSIGSKGYIGTGSAPIPTKDFWEYDPASTTWTQNANFGGVSRIRAAGFSIGSKG